MEVSGCLDKKRLSTGTVGFGLAPRINAAGRLEQAMMAVEMLTTDDPDRGRRDRASSSIAATRGVRRVERKILDEAHADDSRPTAGWVTVGRSCWASKAGTPGVIGIVAGRLAETYHRPTIVIVARTDGRPGLGALDRGLRPLRGASRTARRA